MVDLSTPEKLEAWLVEDHWATVHKVDFGEVQVSLHCASVTDLCRAWVECQHRDCHLIEDPGPEGWEDVRHGAHHIVADQRWTVASDHCVTALPVHRSVEDYVLLHGIEVGTYPVEVGWTTYNSQGGPADYVEVVSWKS